ncbi:MAG: ribosome-associated translation inhibitor RaiA [Firmicutes bacterium]|nr:ribosome-associated translation inhibitor RaiA [Bacillota bacterium]
MTINYKGKNIEVTPALKEHAEKKIGRLNRIMDIDKVTVTLIAEGNREKAEVSMMIKGYLLRGEDSGQDVFAAIDTVVDKLEKQLVKYKEKLQRKTKKDKGKVAEAVVEEVAYTEPDDELVRTKRFQVKPMTVDEAIMQMNMIGHSFFVFANSENEEEINVVYVRNDGKYGLIVPEK